MDATPTRLDAVALAAGRVPDLGDFADRPWELVALTPGTLEVRREGRLLEDAEGTPQPIAMTKRLVLGGGRLDPTLEVSLEVENRSDGPVDVDLGLEFAFDLMGGGGNPAATYERIDAGSGALVRSAHDGSGDLDGADELAFGNRDAGLRVELHLDAPARLTWYPVETVSNSEAGFERVYQGSCVLVRWPLTLEPGATARHRARFEIAQERDLGEEDLRSDFPAADTVTRAEIPAIEEGVA